MTPPQTGSVTGATPRLALFTGGMAAILASTCCLGPLVLLALGFSGAWISTLTMLEPYRPIFIALAVAALLIAGRRIWRPRCVPGDTCAMSKAKRTYKTVFGAVAMLVFVAMTFPYIAPLFY